MYPLTGIYITLVGLVMVLSRDLGTEVGIAVLGAGIFVTLVSTLCVKLKRVSHMFSSEHSLFDKMSLLMQSNSVPPPRRGHGR